MLILYLATLFLKSVSGIKNDLERHINIALIYHPGAGKGKATAVYNLVRHKLEQRGIRFSSFHPPWPIQLTEFTSAWIIGGDGTLHHFINQYVDIKISIALFKGGSGNDFAWKLYGEQNTEEYFETALQGKSQPVDVGICNGIHFINGVGIGFDGEVVRSMGKKKILPGHLSYLATVLKKIFMYREFEMKIITGDRTIAEKIFMLSIANGSRYGGGFLVAPLANINDGMLDIIAIKKIAPMKRIFYLPSVGKGSHLGLPFIDSFQSKKISVESNRNMTAHLDGEYFEAKKVNIEILPSKFLFIR